MRCQHYKHLLSGASLIHDRYKFVRVIGEGAFGVVLLVSDSESDEERVLKLECGLKRTQTEVAAYERLKGTVGVAKCVDTFSILDGKHGCLVLESYGPSLEMCSEDRTLTVREVCGIGCKLVKTLQAIHEKSLVHRDIKPSNILLRTQPPFAQPQTPDGLVLDLLLIDFGHAAPYKLDNGEYVDQNRSPYGAAGNGEFMSFNIHMGIANTPRDDMISLAYSLIHLMRNGLPWSDKRTQPDMIIKLKQKFNPSKLVPPLPEGLVRFTEYVTSLKFKEKPDYAMLSGLLSMPEEES